MLLNRAELSRSEKSVHIRLGVNNTKEGVRRHGVEHPHA